MKTTVILVEDHCVVRQCVKALLAPEADLEVIGEAADGLEAVRIAKARKPGVVVMDLVLPGLDGLEATRQISQAVPSTKILAMSVCSDVESVGRMMAAGGAGFLAKETAATELATAIREVAKGNVFFSPAIFRRLGYHRRVGLNGCCRFDLPSLTRRETQVLRLVGLGRSNKEIALELQISVKTVEKHRQFVMDKLNLHDTARLTRYALSKRLVKANSGEEPENALSA